jgi:ADP-ribose pyrophosphatase YjhB (NUDIX family)
MSLSTEDMRFCPRCATPLERRDDHGTPRPTCPRCGFIHYRNPVPAAGVILSEGARVLLVKRAYDPRAGAWCLPAGFMEAGETPEHTAVREAREETGLEVALTGLFGVYAGFDDPRVRAVLVLYTADRAGGELRPGDDAIEAKFFALARLPKDIAFASHRQALAEFHDRTRRLGAHARRRKAAASPASPASRASSPKSAAAVKRARPAPRSRPRPKRSSRRGPR